MHAETICLVKAIILKMVKRRTAITERELADIAEIKHQAKDRLPAILAELVQAGDLMFMEFVHDDLPSTVHTLYFPAGTICYEPGLSVKSRIIPDHIEQFFTKMIGRGVLESEFVEGLDREGKILYYDTLHKHVQTGGKLSQQLTRTILERLVLDGKVTLRREDHIL